MDHVENAVANISPHLERGAQPRRWTRHWRTLMASLIASLGACGLGTVVSYPAVAIPDMNSNQNNYNLSELEVALVVSIASLGGLLGAMVGGYFLDRFGRKTALLFTTAPFVFGWLMIVASSNVYYMYAGRMLTGLSAGVMDVSTSVYISEISTASVRGFMGSFNDLLVNIGVLYVFALSNYLSWRWQAEACLIVIAAMAVGMLMVPESPRWLLKTGRREECVDSLRWLRGQDDLVKQEMSEIVGSVGMTQRSHVTWKDLMQSNVYFPVFVIISLLFFQQMTGLGVFQYTVDILQAGKSEWNPNAETAVVGACGVLANLLSAAVVDRVGRRAMLIVSAAVMTFSLAGLAAYFTLLELNFDVTHYSVSVFICVVVYNTALSLGYGPIPFYLASELLPLKVRGVAGGLAISSVWMFTFITGISFPYAVSALGYHGMFWMTTCFALFSTLFAVFVVPETKGLSLEQIEKCNTVVS